MITDCSRVPRRDHPSVATTQRYWAEKPLVGAGSFGRPGRVLGSVLSVKSVVRTGQLAVY